jgi:uncharacterized protein
VRALNRVANLRAIGFDDGPFPRAHRGAVPLVGAVCSGTRFEGMVLGRVRRDGRNATDALCGLLRSGKFLPQLHLVLLDGIAFGGFNVVDLPRLARTLRRPCVAVMRRPPDLPAVHRALQRLPRAAERAALLEAAGPVHQLGGFVFQVQGGQPEQIALALERLTDTGRVPECLRLAHLIGTALVTGQSGRRA